MDFLAVVFSLCSGLLRVAGPLVHFAPEHLMMMMDAIKAAQEIAILKQQLEEERDRRRKAEGRLIESAQESALRTRAETATDANSTAANHSQHIFFSFLLPRELVRSRVRFSTVHT